VVAAEEEAAAGAVAADRAHATIRHQAGGRPLAFRPLFLFRFFLRDERNRCTFGWITAQRCGLRTGRHAGHCRKFERLRPNREDLSRFAAVSASVPDTLFPPFSLKI
jgi:hypothetical protein